MKKRGARARAHADDRPQPRHPRRADHLRAEARRLVRRAGRARRERARARAAGRCAVGKISGAVGTFANVDPRVEAFVMRAARPRGRRGGGDPGRGARPARRLLHGARGGRGGARAARDRGPPPAAHRGARGGGALHGGPEGLVGDAAQAQPHPLREPDRPRAPAARLRARGARGRGALARARHQPLLGRAGHRPGRHHRARLRAAPLRRDDREPARLPRADAREPRPDRRPLRGAARAARARGEGRRRGRRPTSSSSATR